MEWQIVVALMLAIPIVLLPAVFVWYMNLGSVFASLRARRAVRAKEAAVAKVKAE